MVCVALMPVVTTSNVPAAPSIANVGAWYTALNCCCTMLSTPVSYCRLRLQPMRAKLAGPECAYTDTSNSSPTYRGDCGSDASIPAELSDECDTAACRVTSLAAAAMAVPLPYCADTSTAAVRVAPPNAEEGSVDAHSPMPLATAGRLQLTT